MIKIVCISDTHAKHRKFSIPKGDILIHAGGIMTVGYDLSEVEDFNSWLGELPHYHKIVIAGNHDRLLEIYPNVRGCLTNAVYLENSGVELAGLKFWGSPATPEFCNWAFNYRRGEEIDKIWQLIPDDTDVLITHGPPAGIRDWIAEGSESLGCRNLREAIKRVKPKLCVFGHLHGGHGIEDIPPTKFVNASLLDEKYQPAYEPIVVELSS
jgi:Icc-related predicted phosphoesterase